MFVPILLMSVALARKFPQATPNYENSPKSPQVTLNINCIVTSHGIWG